MADLELDMTVRVKLPKGETSDEVVLLAMASTQSGVFSEVTGVVSVIVTGNRVVD